MRWIALSTLVLLGACGSDAGCISYGIARGEMPRPLADDATGRWVADLDDRMTGTCR